MIILMKSKVKNCKKIKGLLWEVFRLKLRSKKLVFQRNIKKLQKKESLYAKRLIQARRFSAVYGGLSKKLLHKKIVSAKKNRGVKICNFIRSIESRLDVCLFRMNFFQSFRAARQFISHGGILVNYKAKNISSSVLFHGDIVAVSYFGKRLLRSGHKKLTLNLSSQFLLKRFQAQSKSLRQALRILGNSKQGIYNHKSITHFGGQLLKPSNLETNYKILTSIFLFPMQDLFFPTKAHFESIVHHYK